jgi:hypothetical protein
MSKETLESLDNIETLKNVNEQLVTELNELSLCLVGGGSNSVVF